jgi:hypothetical protein
MKYSKGRSVAMARLGVNLAERIWKLVGAGEVMCGVQAVRRVRLGDQK